MSFGRRYLLWIVAMTVWATHAVSAENSRQLLEDAERIRFAAASMRFSVDLVSYVSGRERSRTFLTVLSKSGSPGGVRNLVQYEAPARDAGKRVLLDRTALWFYDPQSRASVRISGQQRLLGQASIADVLTVSLVNDYDVQEMDKQSVQDGAGTTRESHHFTLVAKGSAAMYGKVEYWIEVDTHQPIKGRFYGDSGVALKTIYYSDYKQVMGRLRPTRSTIVDAVDRNLVTTATSSQHAETDIPEEWFHKDYLGRAWK